LSVLLIEPDDTNGPAVVRLLVSEGDDVGVIVGDGATGDRWKAIGAYVAAGAADDPDLIERASQHARSIVLFDATLDVLNAAIEGTRLAQRSPARIIYCATGGVQGVDQALKASGLEYVLLAVPIARVGFRRRTKQAVDPTVVAEAVSAADDISGEVRLEVDPVTSAGREALALDELRSD
jgi:CheY-like chemotaxis protein